MRFRNLHKFIIKREQNSTLSSLQVNGMYYGIHKSSNREDWYRLIYYYNNKEIYNMSMNTIRDFGSLIRIKFDNVTTIQVDIHPTGEYNVTVLSKRYPNQNGLHLYSYYKTTFNHMVYSKQPSAVTLYKYSYKYDYDLHKYTYEFLGKE